MIRRIVAFIGSFLISILLIHGSKLGVLALEGGFGTSFDDPSLPGWHYTEGVLVRNGVLVIEPGNFASFPGVFPRLNLTVWLRRLGTGNFVMSFDRTQEGEYHLSLGMDSIEIQREAHGSFDTLGYAPAIIPSEGWFEINLVATGGEFSVAVDGDEKLAVFDPDPLPPGGVAFEPLGAISLEIDEMVLIYDGGAPMITPGPESADIVQEKDLSWIRTGGPLGGLGYDVRMHPHNPDFLFVTDAFAGVFKSEDGGKTWYPTNQGITTRGGTSGDAIPIFCLTIDPNNPDIVWAGTQNTRGIFKSMDGGETWIEKDDGIIESEGITFRGITVDPHSSDIVYAAAEIASFVWSDREQVGREFDKTKGVVYKSRNGGESWQPIWRGDNLARYIIVDPRDSDVLYVSTGIFDREAANSDHATNTPGGVGVIKSTDGGTTWSQINNGITNLYVGSLFMHPDNPDILLAGSGNNAYYEGAGVFLTTDGGGTWEKVLESGVQSVEFAASDPDIAYAGEPGWIYRSDDGGQSWRVMNGSVPGWGPPGVEAGFPIDFQVDPQDPDRMFANNYLGGNFLTEDGGKTWVVASTGYTGAQVRAIAVSPLEPAQVFVSARSGFFSTNDGGQNWYGLVFPEAAGLEWNAVHIDPFDPGHILAANNWLSRMVESVDGGKHWRVIDVTIPEMHGWRVIKFAPSNAQFVYAGTGAYFSAGGFDPSIKSSGIFASSDGGTTWNEVNNDLSKDSQIADLAIDPHNPHRVLAAAIGDGVLLTKDGGTNWVQITGLPPNSRPLSIAFHPADPDITFVGMELGGLYRSTDGGDSWRSTSSGMPPESTVTSIVLNPKYPSNVYISLISGGVYQSEDTGETWKVMNNGLRTRAVNALAISNDGWHLYAATEGEGVFRLDLNGEPPEPVVIEHEPELLVDEPVKEKKPEDMQAASQPGADRLKITQTGVEPKKLLETPEPEQERKFPCFAGMLPMVLVGVICLSFRLKRDPQ
jgi:photosystem II stability/assembly factor-like uncharacterized protein